MIQLSVSKVGVVWPIHVHVPVYVVCSCSDINWLIFIKNFQDHNYITIMNPAVILSANIYTYIWFIPYKTKAATAWGVGIFSDWASKRILKLYHLSREFAVCRPLYRNRISALYHLSQLLITAHST